MVRDIKDKEELGILVVGLIYTDHCALRARKQGQRSHLTRCFLCTASASALLLPHYCYYTVAVACVLQAAAQVTSGVGGEVAALVVVEVVVGGK